LNKDLRDEKIKQALVKQKFAHDWYPHCWLVFIWYGPPAESGQQLPHLSRLHMLGDATVEEQLVAMGTASRANRKAAKANIMGLKPADGAGASVITTATAPSLQQLEVRKVIAHEKTPYQDFNELISTLKDEIQLATSDKELLELQGMLKDALKSKREHALSNTKK